MIGFAKATKEKIKLRMAIDGPAGSGKTYTALAIATHLVPNGKIAVIDTEHRSARKYAGEFEFDVDDTMETFHPQRYIDRIHEAEKAGYDVLIIDSLSHAWFGKDGVLQLVDQVAARSSSKNTFAAWNEGSKVQVELTEAILKANIHIIATMRTKTEYVIEKDDQGKNVPRKLGLAPVQREGMEFEFDVIGDMDLQNNLVVTKTRCTELTGKMFPKPGEEIATILRDWLSDGAERLVPTCACGAVIEPIAGHSIEETLAASREAFGAELCKKCRKAKKEELAAQEATPAAGASTLGDRCRAAQAAGSDEPVIGANAPAVQEKVEPNDGEPKKEEQNPKDGNTPEPAPAQAAATGTKSQTAAKPRKEGK